MSSFSDIPALSIAAAISSTPSNGATLPWHGSQKAYQWTATLTITAQNTSGIPPSVRQLFTYNGMDVNVGMWVGSLTSGLAWQIVSISAKSTTSITCVLQDTFRYNTYRDPTKTGNGKPTTGSYVIFNISEAGIPIVDPAPTGIGVNFLSTLISRFQYINNQYDFALYQSGVAGPVASVNYGTGYTGTSAGSGYVNGTYTNVSVTTSGTGTGAQATFVIEGGTVASIIFTSYGNGYLTSPTPDTISVSNTFLGGSGSGFVGKVAANFTYGDVIALDTSTGTYVVSDSTHLNVIGTCTGTDDTGTYFTVNAIQKVDDLLNYLPGTVGDIIYTSTTVPGGLTLTPGGTETYLQLRTQTSSTTTSSTFASPTSIITTVGYTFSVNGVIAVVGGTGTLTDVENAINAISAATGVNATIAGTYFIQCTAVDARPINFTDDSGSTVEDAGLISVENGIKAAGMFITNSRQSANFSSVLGFTSVQGSATSWTITHNGNTPNYIAQVFDTGGNVIVPDGIATTNVNTVTITFANAQAGTAQLSLFIPQPA